MSMTNEEIMAEFGTLFSSAADEPQDPTPEDEPTNDTGGEEVEPTTDSQQGEGETDPEPESDPEPEPSRDDKANHAFAELRTKNKRNESLIRGLGKAIGLGDDISTEQISEALQDYIIKQESKKTGIPEETLKEIEQLRGLVNENNQLKIERDTQQAFINLSNKYKIDQNGMREFAQHLIDNDINPLSGAQVDIEAEYIKLHWDDMLKNAFDSGVEQEKARKQKVEDHAGTPAPGSSKDNQNKPQKIESVRDLERFFDGLDL